VPGVGVEVRDDGVQFMTGPEVSEVACMVFGGPFKELEIIEVRMGDTC
jgi:hypothetical protein